MQNTGVSERSDLLQDDSGYRMELHEIALNQMGMKWGTYSCPYEKKLSFYPVDNTIVSHFRITDPSTIINQQNQRISEKKFVVYRETPEPYDLYIAATKEKTCTFFELSMSYSLFEGFRSEESNFLSRFSSYVPTHTPSIHFTASIAPVMYSIINDMQRTSFQGHLRRLYLESKAMELFLLEIAQLDKKDPQAPSKLTKRDIECLHDIKQYIELHFDQPTSIAALSRRAGINQMKLKTGFKQLFNTTIFSYLHSIRMQEARRLLLDENMCVSETADRIGYKHPQHFTAAFKKQFNITPSQLRK
ncbi:MAG TPA: AraC family transcriptional regulator [Puia sp.]|nr:AraC family transcriptional regulator [Puia sp.]